jgi:hypothetical protein
LRVFGQLSGVTADGLCFLIHIFFDVFLGTTSRGEPKP